MKLIVSNSTRPGFEPGKPDEKAGIAGGDWAPVAGRYPNQADQDRWAAGTTPSRAGGPVGRGYGDEGSAGWNAGPDQRASACIRAADLGSAENDDVDAVVQGKWSALPERLGQAPAILGFYPWRGSGYHVKVSRFSERIAIDTFAVPFYSWRHLIGSHGWGTLFD